MHDKAETLSRDLLLTPRHPESTQYCDLKPMSYLAMPGVPRIRLLEYARRVPPGFLSWGWSAIPCKLSHLDMSYQLR